MLPTETDTRRAPLALVAVVLIVIVVAMVLVAALLADWGDDGSGSSDEATVSNSWPTAHTSPARG